MEEALDEKALSGMPTGAKESVRGHLILAEVVNDALTKYKEVCPSLIIWGVLYDFWGYVLHRV